MSDTSNTVGIVVTSPSVPAWFTSLSHKQWTTPLSNWLGDDAVEPLPSPGGTTGQVGIINEWTGMGADQTNKMIFMLANGGHNSYYGNEVYSCDLSAASPAWIRRRDPSTPTGYPNTITHFADGRPCSMHTTELTASAEGRWFQLGMPGTNYNGSTRNQQWWEFKPFDGAGTISGQANDWIDLGTANHPTYSGSAGIRGCAMWDAVDRQFIIVHGNNVSPSITYQSIDNMAGAPALQNTTQIAFNDFEACAIDTTNRILLMRSIAVGGAPMYRWVSLASNATKTGAINSITAPGGTAPPLPYAMYWHPASQAFITYDGASGFRKLTPTVSGGAYTSLGNWTAVSGTTGTPPSNPINLLYSKINLIHDMGDGTSAFIVVPRYQSPDVYVCRLTGTL